MAYYRTGISAGRTVPKVGEPTRSNEPDRGGVSPTEPSRDKDTGSGDYIGLAERPTREMDAGDAVRADPTLPSRDNTPVKPPTRIGYRMSAEPPPEPARHEQRPTAVEGESEGASEMLRRHRAWLAEEQSGRDDNGASPPAPSASSRRPAPAAAPPSYAPPRWDGRPTGSRVDLNDIEKAHAIATMGPLGYTPEQAIAAFARHKAELQRQHAWSGEKQTP